MQLFILVSLSLLFLSANSIFARMALITQNIDAFSFTFLRLFSGAILLLIIYFYKTKTLKFDAKKNWISSFMLFLYAICFSYSYVNMEAGVGTLILFASVQISMILIAIFYKEKFTFKKALGVIIAFSGLFYLLYPKEEFFLSFYHSFLMILSGIAWAIYSVLGKKSTNATLNTTDNFLKATLFVILFMFIFISELKFDLYTASLAIISGSLTSAVGYLIWYFVLPKMEITTASILQLLVPIIAIFLGVVFLDESLTLELMISTILILLGILIALFWAG
jgi:drug/metabolite transporter (DMT)-like permease